MKKGRLHILCFILLFVIVILFILISSRTCKTHHKKVEFESNFPFYDTKDLKICKIVDQLLEIKEKISPGGGYFGSHSRWAKLIVHMPYQEKKYEVDIYYSYNKDGVNKLNSCNIFLVSYSNGVTYQTDKGWYFSDDLIRDLCYQISIEKSLPMPIFASEKPTPAPFTLSYYFAKDSQLFKHVEIFFSRSSTHQSVIENNNEIARLIVKGSDPSSMSDFLHSNSLPTYQVILFDEPGYFQIHEFSDSGIEFTKKIVSKDCYDCSMYYELIKFMRKTGK